MDDLDSFLDPDLVLPVRGRPVRIPPPTARVGLRLRRQLLDAGDDALNGFAEQRAIRDLLGFDLDAELASTLPEGAYLHVGRTALMYWAGNADTALLHWDAAEWRRIHQPKPLDPSAPGYLGDDDPGGGPIIDAENGIRAWFNDPREAPVKSGDLNLSWRDVFTCWTDVTLDLHERFGVDVHSPILDERPWPWLEARIRDLAMTQGTRLNRAILAPLYSKGTTAP